MRLAAQRPHLSQTVLSKRIAQPPIGFAIDRAEAWEITAGYDPSRERTRESVVEIAICIQRHQYVIINARD
jgi:hypothetical protein